MAYQNGYNFEVFGKFSRCENYSQTLLKLEPFCIRSNYKTMGVSWPRGRGFSHLGRKAGSGSDGQLFCWTVRANGYQTQVNVSRPNHHLQWDHVVHLITRMVKGNTLFNGALEIHSRLKIVVSWLAFCQQACREEVELIVIDTNSY